MWLAVALSLAAYSDGLAMPADAGKNPVPVVLEYLPYRKRDGTHVRDALTVNPYLREAGFFVFLAVGVALSRLLYLRLELPLADATGLRDAARRGEAQSPA